MLWAAVAEAAEVEEVVDPIRLVSVSFEERPEIQEKYESSGSRELPKFPVKRGVANRERIINPLHRYGN